jgi:hypothetical protein
MATQVKSITLIFTLHMKRLLFIALILVPRLSFAQLNDDGKTFEKVSIEQNTNVKASTILFSGLISDYGFLAGAKYQYCKTFGGYASLNSSFGGSDYNNTVLALGPVKSLGKKAFFYIGGGINFANDSYSYSGYSEEESFMEGVIEGGFMFKISNAAIDIGGGYLMDDAGYLTVGFGFSF